MSGPVVEVLGVGVPLTLASGAAALARHSRHLRDLHGLEGEWVKVSPPEESQVAHTEGFWRRMHQFVVPPVHRWIHGQGHFGWELRVLPAGAELYVWASEGLRTWWELRDAVEQSWPGARAESPDQVEAAIEEAQERARATQDAPPPDEDEPEEVIWATTLWHLGRSDDKELLVGAGQEFWTAFLGHARKALAPSEEIVLQVLARPSAARIMPDPTPTDWVSLLIAGIRGYGTVKAPAPPKEPRSGKPAEPPFYEVEVRLACAAVRESHAVQRLSTMAATLGTLSAGNHLHRERRFFHIEDRRMGKGSLFTVPELAAVAHMPAAALLAGDNRKVIPAPSTVDDKGRALGANLGRPVAMPRLRTYEHTEYVGPTGVGKTSAMVTAELSDIEQGIGTVDVDLDGERITLMLKNLPPGVEDRLCLIDLDDPDYCVGLNLLDGPKAELNVSNLIALFEATSTGWGSVQEGALRGICMVLIHLGQLRLSPLRPTLVEVPSFIDSLPFRIACLETLDQHLEGPDAEVDRQFIMGFDRIKELEPLRNKVRGFLSWSDLLCVIGQSPDKNPFDMLNPDKGSPGGVIFVRAPSGTGGATPADLLASACIQRSWEQGLRPRGPDACPIALNLDELRSLVTAKEFLGDIGRQGRKKRFALSAGYQYPASLPAATRDLLRGTIRNKIYFAQDDDKDARVAAKLFQPTEGRPGMTEQEFMAFGMYRAAVRLGGPPYWTFDTNRLPEGSEERKRQCVEASRRRWARPRAEVEAEIVERMRNPLVVLGRTGRPRVRML